MRHILLGAMLLLLAAPAQAGWSPAGQWRITGYCVCKKCCGKCDGVTADGTRVAGSRGTILSAPPNIPFGTRVWIEGVGVAVVHDRGGAIRGRRMEILFNSHSQARQWGVQQRAVQFWSAGN